MTKRADFTLKTRLTGAKAKTDYSGASKGTAEFIFRNWAIDNLPVHVRSRKRRWIAPGFVFPLSLFEL